MNKNKQNPIDEDDGFTVVNMNVDGMKGYVSDSQKKQIKEMRGLHLTKKERRAIFWGAMKAMLPMLLFIVVGFAIAIGFCYLWLNQ
jgi:hypothetical protein